MPCQRACRDRRSPCLVASDEVARVDPELDELRRGKRRRVSVRAYEAEAAIRELLVAPLRGLVGPPRQHRVRDVLRAGNDAGALALLGGADVDDEQVGIRSHLFGRVARDPGASHGEHVVYPRNCGSTFLPKSRICSCRFAPQSSSITCVQPASRYSSIASMQSDGVPAIGRHLSRSASETSAFAASRPPRSIASATGRISSCAIPASSSSVSAAPWMFCTLFARYMPAISRAPSRPASRSFSWIEATTVQPTSISPPTLSRV